MPRKKKIGTWTVPWHKRIICDGHFNFKKIKNKTYKKYFDWNKVDFSKYPNGVYLFKEPISGVKIPSKKPIILSVKYWDWNRWE